MVQFSTTLKKRDIVLDILINFKSNNLMSITKTKKMIPQI